MEEARIPSLSSFFPSDSPAVGIGTRNALIPYKKTQPQEWCQLLTHLTVRGLSPNVFHRSHLSRWSRQERAKTEQSHSALNRVPRASSERSSCTTPWPPPSLPACPKEHTLCFRDLSVVANTTVAEASQALVIQALVPFRTHSSPSSRATVEAAPASLPFPEAGTSKHHSGSQWQPGAQTHLHLHPPISSQHLL